MSLLKHFCTSLILSYKPLDIYQKVWGASSKGWAESALPPSWNLWICQILGGGQWPPPLRIPDFGIPFYQHRYLCRAVGRS